MTTLKQYHNISNSLLDTVKSVTESKLPQEMTSGKPNGADIKIKENHYYMRGQKGTILGSAGEYHRVQFPNHKGVVLLKKKDTFKDAAATGNPAHFAKESVNEGFSNESVQEAYSERTLKSALTAHQDFPKTGHMHISNFKDDENHFKVHVIDKQHPAIQHQIATKDISTPAGRLAHNQPANIKKIQASPKRYHGVSEFEMTWRHGGERPNPKDPRSYYTSHHGEYDTLHKAIEAHAYGVSKRNEALSDLYKHGIIKSDKPDELKSVASTASAHAAATKPRLKLHTSGEIKKIGESFDLLEMVRGDEGWVAKNLEALKKKREHHVKENKDTSVLDSLIHKHEKALKAVQKEETIQERDEGKPDRNKVKKMQEEIELQEMGRGRPAKSGAASAEPEADQNIMVHLHKSVDTEGKHDVPFLDKQTKKVDKHVAHTLVNALERVKPDARFRLQQHIHQSHENMMQLYHHIVGKGLK